NLLASNREAQATNQESADLFPQQKEQIEKQVADYEKQLAEARVRLQKTQEELPASFRAAGPSADSRSVVLQGAVDRNKELV
ncbi:hypothetical protein ACYT69_11940, partial [Streptococcus pyogenes]